MRGLGRLVLAAMLCSVSTAQAASTTIDGVGFTLRYDADAWIPQDAVPPSLLTLRCATASCPKETLVTFVRDTRALPIPGFRAFGPAAAIGASIDLRIQDLTPGARILARQPVKPIEIGGTSGYRGLYDIEDRSLARTSAAIVLLRTGEATMEIRMSMPHLDKGATDAFDRLTAGITFMN